jgi:hypothetical protein
MYNGAPTVERGDDTIKKVASKDKTTISRKLFHEVP